MPHCFAGESATIRAHAATTRLDCAGHMGQRRGPWGWSHERGRMDLGTKSDWQGLTTRVAGLETGF